MNFSSTKADYDAIGKIADRAEIIYGADYPRCDLVMDLDACNSNGCPMDFDKLLSAPKFDFCHDIAGIHRHINRQTGQVEDCFLPRCAK